jgi:hypothetical protein
LIITFVGVTATGACEPADLHGTLFLFRSTDPLPSTVIKTVIPGFRRIDYADNSYKISARF